MEEPLTEDMLAELLSAPDPRAFMKKATAGQRSLSDYLNELLEAKGLKRAAVVRAAGINETFGYQVFTGARKASRDNLLKIALAMGCTLREANRLLKAGGVNELYCKTAATPSSSSRFPRGLRCSRRKKTCTGSAKPLSASAPHADVWPAGLLSKAGGGVPFFPTDEGGRFRLQGLAQGAGNPRMPFGPKRPADLIP